MDEGLLELPPYNWMVKTDKGAHVTWCLENPVHDNDSSSIKAIRYLAAIRSYYEEKTFADPHYTHTLTRNPLHEDASTIYGTKEPYELDKLSNVIPFSWKQAPKVKNYGIGRNHDLFATLMIESGFSRNHDRPLLPMGFQINQTFPDPLLEKEVISVVNSVERYRSQKHQTWS